MSLIDKLQEVKPVKSGKGCLMCKVLESLPEEERNALNDAMSVPTDSINRITDRQLAEILRSEGYDLSLNSVYRHRQNHMDKQ
jgi:Mg/Co/Ni transporter MgtE